MNHKILKVLTSDHVLICTFEDGSLIKYDMTQTVKEKGEMISPLRDLKFFSKAFVECGAVAWPNGFDICPNSIYLNGKKQKKSRSNQ